MNPSPRTSSHTTTTHRGNQPSRTFANENGLVALRLAPGSGRAREGRGGQGREGGITQIILRWGMNQMSCTISISVEWRIAWSHCKDGFSSSIHSSLPTSFPSSPFFLPLHSIRLFFPLFSSLSIINKSSSIPALLPSFVWSFPLTPVHLLSCMHLCLVFCIFSPRHFP